ncbi:MAG: peptidylprolyl isomerase, partial [Oscillospiraceae bacterium]|nr:peptidylprolyl isomerase [Oscillospiraceae bacterium]
MANKKKKAGQAITPKKEVVQKKADAKLYITLAVAVLALAIITVGIVLIIKATSSAKTQTQPTAAEPSQTAEETAEETAAYYADISIRDYGTVTLELYPETAPITVDNFVTLARSGFYDGLTFHRIMNGFMMQGGDPDG